MIDPTHRFPITQQAQLLDLSRSSVYYRPALTAESDLAKVCCGAAIQRVCDAAWPVGSTRLRAGSGTLVSLGSSPSGA